MTQLREQTLAAKSVGQLILQNLHGKWREPTPDRHHMCAMHVHTGAPQPQTRCEILKFWTVIKLTETVYRFGYVCVKIEFSRNDCFVSFLFSWIISTRLSLNLWFVCQATFWNSILFERVRVFSHFLIKWPCTSSLGRQMHEPERWPCLVSCDVVLCTFGVPGWSHATQCMLFWRALESAPLLSTSLGPFHHCFFSHLSQADWIFWWGNNMAYVPHSSLSFPIPLTS